MSRILKRRAARLLAFERLNSRICLAVEAVLNGSVLTITGTPEDDTILISDSRDGDIVVATRDPDARFEPFAGVERIVVNTLAGDDSVRYHVRQTGSVPAEFDLGDGDDELSAHMGFGSGEPTDSATQLEVNGGAGVDDVRIAAMALSGRKTRDDAANARLILDADLGDGDDRLRFGGHGALEATIDVNAGEGDDEVAIGMLLPAVQRIREAAAASRLEVNADLGAGNDELRLRGHGSLETTIDVAAGAGDDEVQIGLLLPAVRKFRDEVSMASIDVDLGPGEDELSMSAVGVKKVDLNVAAGDGDDQVRIGLLLPAVRPVAGSTANITVDLGPGADRLELKARGYETVETNISGDEDEGDDVNVDVEPHRPPTEIPIPLPRPLPRPLPLPRRGR